MDNVAFELQNKWLIPEAPKVLKKWLETDISNTNRKHFNCSSSSLVSPSASEWDWKHHWPQWQGLPRLLGTEGNEMCLCFSQSQPTPSNHPALLPATPTQHTHITEAILQQANGVIQPFNTQRGLFIQQQHNREGANRSKWALEWFIHPRLLSPFSSALILRLMCPISALPTGTLIKARTTSWPGFLST